jgi:hypothetical protein
MTLLAVAEAAGLLGPAAGLPPPHPAVTAASASAITPVRA